VESNKNTACLFTLDVRQGFAQAARLDHSKPNETLAGQLSPFSTEILRASSAKAISAQLLPLPLTEAALNNAYIQLISGAKNFINTVIQWWHTNKLSSSEFLTTVQSFTGSSAALRKIFTTPNPESEYTNSQSESEQSCVLIDKRSYESSPQNVDRQPMAVCRKGFFKDLAKNIRERHQSIDNAGPGDAPPDENPHE